MAETDAEKYDQAYKEVNEDGSIEGLEASFIEVDGITDRVDGIRTRYYDYGDGDPLVLLHGGNWGGSSNANTWSRVIEDLSETFRVLAVDRIGCGMTEAPDDPDDFIYDADYEHVISFLDTLGYEEAHFAGQSRGGGLAGRVAVEVPDRVKTLTVVNSGSLSPTSPDKDFMYTRALRDAPDDESSPTYHAEYIRHLYEAHEYSPHHVTDEFVMAAGYMDTRPEALRVAEIMDEEGGYEQWLETFEEHMSETYHRIRQGTLQMPTLVYWGRDDPSVPLTSGVSLYELLAKKNPRTYLEIINRAGHHPYREYPELFDHHITSFVEFHEEHGYDYGEPEITYDMH